jgi:hypothetical protein
MKSVLTVFLFFSSTLFSEPRIQYDEAISEDFVIRWAFQALCDHHFDPRTVWPTPSKNDQPVSFDPHEVKAGDMIFVRDFEYFFTHKHEKIKVPYFVLTHGEFLDKFCAKYQKYLRDGKILAWFTIHPCELTDERIIPIPLGIVQYHELFAAKKKMHKRLTELRNSKKEKLLYMNFTEWCMPERTRIRKLFEHQSFVTYTERCEFNNFIQELSHHKFVLSPPGLGPDCYRVWESALVGSIPIVQHSYFDFMYEGLPVLFIDGWEEVTEEFLEQKYLEMSSKIYSSKRLNMEYWIGLIDKVRKKFWPNEACQFKSLKEKLVT